MLKVRNYMKRKQERVDLETLVEEVATSQVVRKNAGKRHFLFGFLALFVTLAMTAIFIVRNDSAFMALDEDVQIATESLPVAAVSAKKATIAIPSGTVKANPFMPYRNIGDSSSSVPAVGLVEPPDSVNISSDAARVMDTIVSGILYDAFSPSAILNIEGNDYLVKKGDVVNNYKVLAITQDSVTVQLGVNVYKAGIGEILTEGSMNHNEVSNLSNKFGGERQ